MMPHSTMGMMPCSTMGTTPCSTMHMMPHSTMHGFIGYSSQGMDPLQMPFLELFPVELLDKVPYLKSHAATLSANSLSHRSWGFFGPHAPFIYLFICS